MTIEVHVYNKIATRVHNCMLLNGEDEKEQLREYLNHLPKEPSNESTKCYKLIFK